MYANTLGYIYYYGRCNGGVPEYDKAFYYFGIAAANGLYEGMYKLADMFRHGYGCRESRHTARNLYGMVYEDSLKHFLQGRHANFASYEFYYDDEIVAWVRSGHYRFFGKPAKEPYGPEYQIVSVRFNASGRIYDYICDFDVNTGDVVIVEGYNGETEVTVVKVVKKWESELSLPAERYKRIVRKV